MSTIRRSETTRESDRAREQATARQREPGHEQKASAAHGGKTVEESRTVMARSMQPPDANVWGNVHGGAILRLVDEAGGAVAVRHSRCRCVTVAMDSMTFKQPVYIGDLLTVTACLTYVGHTSMEVEAQIESEDLRTGIKRHVGTSYLVYVAIDDMNHPTPAPPLIIMNDEERARWQAAEERRGRRQH